MIHLLPLLCCALITIALGWFVEFAYPERKEEARPMRTAFQDGIWCQNCSRVEVSRHGDICATCRRFMFPAARKTCLCVASDTWKCATARRLPSIHCPCDCHRQIK